MTEVTTQSSTGRSGYHHGDLANALTREAAALAREGGPEAVVLREAARRVGVSATAAYRHFAAHDDLLHAVMLQSHDALADALELARDSAEPSDDPGEAATRRFLAIGRAYIAFSRVEPGLFRTAFCRRDPARAGEPPKDVTEIAGFRSFQLLSGALDELVATGVLTAERRIGAEFPAWSGVHGLALLLLDGPLSWLSPEQQEAIQELTIQHIFRGLAS